MSTPGMPLVRPGEDDDDDAASPRYRLSCRDNRYGRRSSEEMTTTRHLLGIDRDYLAMLCVPSAS